jgi:hypothetical protein
VYHCIKKVEVYITREVISGPAIITLELNFDYDNLGTHWVQTMSLEWHGSRVEHVVCGLSEITVV